VYLFLSLPDPLTPDMCPLPLHDALPICPSRTPKAMRSAAAAFAWEFRQRLRWGLIALGLYFVVLATFQFLILGPRSPIHPLRSMTFAFTVSVPVTFAFMYFLAVFSYGLAGDLTARHSLYPARMFTLPVSTAALA